MSFRTFRNHANHNKYSDDQFIEDGSHEGVRFVRLFIAAPYLSITFSWVEHARRSELDGMVFFHDVGDDFTVIQFVFQLQFFEVPGGGIAE